MLIVLIGISFLTFLLTYLSPGDPVRNMYTSAGIMPTEELIQQTRDEMGFNDPFLTQYARWITNCLKGDFGKSYSLNKPVVSLLKARLWPTLTLTLMSMLLVKRVCGAEAFMANPSQLTDQTSMLAHCTIPLKMCDDFTVRSHFESGIGVAIVDGYYNSCMVWNSKTVATAHIRPNDYYWVTTEITPKN